MGEVIAVVSGKGGVGKTTAVAHIGAALAALGKRVLLVDADMGLRNLDIALGAENIIVYDVADVIDGVCDADTATVKIEGHNELYFIPSPQTRNENCISNESFSEFCRRMAESYDYVLIDGPAGVGNGFFKVVGGADRAMVVAQGFTASLRDADRTIDFLEKEGIKEFFVLINSMRPELVEKGIMLDADFILDVLGTKLLGIVPEDLKILEYASKKELAFGKEDSVSSVAYSNIAKRLLGEQVPIMDFNTRNNKKRKWLFWKKRND